MAGKVRYNIERPEHIPEGQSFDAEIDFNNEVMEKVTLLQFNAKTQTFKSKKILMELMRDDEVVYSSEFDLKDYANQDT